MGIVAEEKRYIEAVCELYPKGLFFDSEFQNSESDLSKLAETKGKEIYRFKNKMFSLWNEARLETCTEETIADYERLYDIKTNASLTLLERKKILLSFEASLFNIYALQKIASLYEAEIIKIEYPYIPSFFGYSRFGQTRITNYHAFNVLYICASDVRNKKSFEEAITNAVFADKIVYFKYEGESI